MIEGTVRVYLIVYIVTKLFWFNYHNIIHTIQSRENLSNLRISKFFFEHPVYVRDASYYSLPELRPEIQYSLSDTPITGGIYIL